MVAQKVKKLRKLADIELESELEILQSQFNQASYIQALSRIESIEDYQQEQRISILRADILRCVNRNADAIAQYLECAYRGGVYCALLFRKVAEVLIADKEIDQAVGYLRRSLSINPDDLTTHYLLAQLLFSSTLQAQASCHANYILEHATDDFMLATAENIFRFSMQTVQAAKVVERRAELCEDPDTYLGLLVCSTQGLCNWEESENYAKKLHSRYYNQGDFMSAREIPLYNIARIADERINLEVVKTAVVELNEQKPAFEHSQHKYGKKVRLGLLSADFASHPVIQLIVGLCEELNKARFEIYAFDDGKNESSREDRFLKCVHKHIDIREQSDEEVAQKVYANKIDILIDLMGLTTKNRIGVLALRPSPVTASFLGFPGTSGVHSVDYVISDKIITPDSSKAFYAEKLCRLPEVFMPNDQEREIASNPVTRAELNLPENAIVFCSFNRSFKLDRRSVFLWLRILQRVPNSVLWQKDDNAHFREVFYEAAKLHGIEPSRIIFAGNTSSVALHLSRVALADICLDTLIYNGHTITADVLWAGIPVITCTGTHFASRVATSLLNALGLSELATKSEQEMEDLAVNLALNPARLRAIKEKIIENTKRYPLFNTKRYTRHFEMALEMMLDRAKKSLAPEHIDVPKLPEENVDFMNEKKYKNEENAGAPDKGDYADMNEFQNLQKSPHAIHFANCPICNGPAPRLGLPIPVIEHSAWTEPLPKSMFWLCCPKCSHIYSNTFWSFEAQNALKIHNTPQDISIARYAQTRQYDIDIVNKVVELIDKEPKDCIWLNASLADASLSISAQSADFKVDSFSTYPAWSDFFRSLGLSVWDYSFFTADLNGQADIISYCDNFAEFPYPEIIIKRAAYILKENGLLLINFDHKNSPAWQLYGFNEHNSYLQDPRNLNVYSSQELCALLEENNFKIVHKSLNARTPLAMSIIAQK